MLYEFIALPHIKGMANRFATGCQIYIKSYIPARNGASYPFALVPRGKLNELSTALQLLDSFSILSLYLYCLESHTTCTNSFNTKGHINNWITHIKLVYTEWLVISRPALIFLVRRHLKMWLLWQFTIQHYWKDNTMSWFAASIFLWVIIHLSIRNGCMK
jgi:hypothetical protein